MCLILLGWKVQADLPLVVAANRDEFHARAAAPAGFWKDRPGILAGRDLEALGTWMGVARNGRFAAVTNYRGATEPKAARSRGDLVVDFLTDSSSVSGFMNHVTAKSFSGFNLLACDGKELWWMSNRNGTPRRLESGLYGLGNLLLDSPDVDDHKARLKAAIAPAPSVEPLFQVLARAKIVNERYGTRCSTVVMQGKDGRTQFAERPYDAGGLGGETLRYEWQS